MSSGPAHSLALIRSATRKAIFFVEQGAQRQMEQMQTVVERLNTRLVRHGRVWIRIGRGWFIGVLTALTMHVEQLLDLCSAARMHGSWFDRLRLVLHASRQTRMRAARQAVLRLNKATTPVWPLIGGNAKFASFPIEAAISAIRHASEPNPDC